MNMVKIRFANQENDAAGTLALARHFKVICLPGDIYEIPDHALSVLETLNLPYTVLETEGFDHAIRTLRNPSASHL